VGRRRVGQVGAGATEAARVLVHVEEYRQPAAQGAGVGVQLVRDPAEHRRGQLGVGGAPAAQPAVDDLAGVRRERPGALVAVGGGVHAGVQRPPGARPPALDLHEQPDDPAPLVVQPPMRQLTLREPVLQHGEDGAVVVDAGAARAADQLPGEVDHVVVRAHGATVPDGGPDHPSLFVQLVA
jgi:hypothetical protein